MAVVRKKQDDKNLKLLRELVTSGGSGGNRQCFDCGQKGPTYVNMTIGSFVCTRCSGVLRGLTPPHRVKSISMATFTPEEIEFLKTHGNDFCAKTWLGLWDPKRIIHQDQRELMIDKYERKRYYLEPASPLKSLTNNAATKAPPTQHNGNIVNGTSNGIHLNGTSSMNGNHHHHHNNSINNNNNNNNNSNNSNISKQVVENNLKNITLTPPSTLHLSNNSINSSSSSTNTSSSRQNSRYSQFQNQFTPDENGFFETSSSSSSGSANMKSNGLMNGNGNTNSNHSHHQQQQHITNGALNALSNNLNQCQISNNKNSLNHQNSTDSFLSKKFTPDSEFVADFGSANIFNAQSVNGSLDRSQQQQQQVNSFNRRNAFKTQQNGTIIGAATPALNKFVNGGEAKAKAGTTTATTMNGNCNANSNSSYATANFADFDHASIYNAAVYQPSIYYNSTLNNNISANNNSNFFANNCYQSDAFSNSSNNISNTISYTTNNNSNNNNYGTIQSSSFNDTAGFTFNNFPFQQPSATSHQQQQWNLWQPFQSPFSTPSPEQNRWSLPMSLNSTSNSLSSSATFTSNSSINSTPPADRYAALKDLDDQLRDSKTSLNNSSFNSPAPAAASPNPFAQSTPIAIAAAASQQQQQHQPHQISNPFQTTFSQATTAPTATTNMFGTTHQSNSLFGGASSPPFASTQQSFLAAYSNGYSAGGGIASNAGSLLTNGGSFNNGCGGLAYVPQQVSTGGNAVITNMKNPFATVSAIGGSNNPFL